MTNWKEIITIQNPNVTKKKNCVRISRIELEQNSCVYLLISPVYKYNFVAFLCVGQYYLVANS